MVAIDIDLAKRRIDGLNGQVGLASYSLAQVVEAVHQMWDSRLKSRLARRGSLVAEFICPVQGTLAALVNEFPERSSYDL